MLIKVLLGANIFKLDDNLKYKTEEYVTDKSIEFGISFGNEKVIEYCKKEMKDVEKEAELYNTVYKEISEIIGLDATLKIYLHFKGQQVNFPVRLYNPHLIQQNVIKEFDVWLFWKNDKKNDKG